MKTKEKTIMVLDGKKAVQVKTVKCDKYADVSYIHPLGHTASANWRILFIREAMDLADEKVFNEACDMVGMPEEYDWSFIRDADSETLDRLSDYLYSKLGKFMEILKLSSVKFRK